MWRRIQTLYLALATLIIGSLFVSRMATVVTAQGEVPVYYYEMIPTALLIFSALSASGIATFAYKYRPVQIRLAVTSALVNFALQINLLYHFFRASDELVFSLTLLFPITASILDTLAARAIMADEVGIKTALKMKKIRAKERKKEKRNSLKNNH